MTEGVATRVDGLEVGMVSDKERRLGFKRFMHSGGGRLGGEAVRWLEEDSMLRAGHSVSGRDVSISVSILVNSAVLRMLGR
jgi:hypothetical protein